MKTRLFFFLLMATSLFAQSGRNVPDVTPPKPEWVPDPSAGHYDCPDGWTAFSRSEPYPVWNGPIAAIFVAPHKDKKGHILGEQPALPICVRDAK